MTKKQKAREIRRLIAYFGGTQASTAKAVGVEQPTVHAWLSGRHGVSAVTALKIERLTAGNFKAVDLCPKLMDVAS